MHLDSLQNLSDHDLVASVEHWARAERKATAAFIRHLAELDTRRLYLDAGYASLFAYCTQRLHFSEQAAYTRIEAARALRRYPVIGSMLESGDLHLTAVRLLAPVLTDDNACGLLAAARHRSRREIEALVASVRPRPDAPAGIRKLPQAPVAVRSTAPAVAAAAAPVLEHAPHVETPGEETHCETRAGHKQYETQTVAVLRSQTSRGLVEALAPDRYRVQFTASAELKNKLDTLRELLRHQVPDGDLAAIVERALDLLLQTTSQRKFAALRPAGQRGASPRTGTAKGTEAAPAAVRGEDPAAAPRAIPAAVRRTVWERDGGQCTFTGPDGTRCAERGGLEFDHRQPFADGGAASAGNIRLLCRSHNQHARNLFFGPWHAEERDAGAARMAVE